MIVRLASVDDAEAIAAVQVRTWQVAYRGQVPDAYLDSMDTGPRRDWWSSTVASDDVPAATFVAGDDRGLIGFCHVCLSRDEDADARTGEVAAIYVVPEAWREGVGRRLMSRGLTHLTESGFRLATLWVIDTNLRGRAFYEALGWLADGAAKVEALGTSSVREVRYRASLPETSTGSPA